MSSCRHFLLVLGVCAVPGGTAYAQTGTPLDNDRVDLNQPVITPEPQGEKSPAVDDTALTTVEAGAASAAPIKSIQFIGTDVPQVVGRAAETFIGVPATRENLQALTRAMSAAYQKSDVALFTVVVPKQDLSTGDLKVLIGEGHIQTVVLEGEVEGRKLDLVKAYAAKLTGEQSLSRRKLERYLSLIRDIPGLKVESRLETGQGRGAVRLVLKLDYAKPKLAISYDNRSTRLIDDGQFNLSGSAYSLLREGDVTEITAASSVNFRDMLYAGISHSTPIGTEGARLSLAFAHLETRPSEIDVSGNAETYAVTFSYPLIRSYQRNLTASLSLDGVDSDNTAFGSILASEQTRAARAALGYSQSGPRTALSGGLTFSHGVDILGAEVPAASGDVGFFKVNARAGISQSIGKSMAVRLRTSAQWSDDPLPAVERFSVGGADFGRAFEKGLVSADRGVSTVAELAIRPLSKGDFSRTEIYTFIDYAYVGLVDRPGLLAQDFDLASAGIGTRLAWKDKAMLGLEAARTINRPFPSYDSEWRFSVSWRLQFGS